MKTFKHLILEISKNQIYHDFRKSINGGVQLPLPFEFNDSFFEDKKEQIDYTLRTISDMIIGYEFEMYLPIQSASEKYKTHYEPDYDYNDPINTTEDFSWALNNYLDTLHNFFHENSTAYNKLEKKYRAWRKEAIEYEADDEANRAVKKWSVLPSTPEMEEEYTNKYKEFYNKLSKELEEDESCFTVDDYFDDWFDSNNTRHNNNNYDSTLLNAIHYFEFESYDYGFDDNGYLITDQEYPVIDNDNDNNHHHHEHFAKYLSGRLNDSAEVEVFSDYHANKKSKHKWYIEPDSSLHNHHGEYFPIEVSTAVYPAHQFKSVFTNALSWFSDYDENGEYPITDASTGLHFSISFSNTSRSIDFLKLIVLGNDIFWLKKVNREFNGYCRSQLKSIKEFIKFRAYDEVNEDNVEEISELISRQIDTSSKMVSINFSKYNSLKYIEFRLLGNNYFDFPNTALKSIEWFLRILVAAATPELFKKEYHQWIINQCNQE